MLEAGFEKAWVCDECLWNEGRGAAASAPYRRAACRGRAGRLRWAGTAVQSGSARVLHCIAGVRGAWAATCSSPEGARSDIIAQAADPERATHFAHPMARGGVTACRCGTCWLGDQLDCRPGHLLPHRVRWFSLEALCARQCVRLRCSLPPGARRLAGHRSCQSTPDGQHDG